MAPIINGNDNEQPRIPNNTGGGNIDSSSQQELKMHGINAHTAEPRNPVEEKTETKKDILAYQDTWIDWDGPVWCSRYGRFENQEDASADDGYTVQGQPPHQDLRLERREKHGCNGRVPHQHISYVQDIQRRIEPMVASLIRLEQQVGTLLHHVMGKDANGNAKKYVDIGFAGRYERSTQFEHAPNDTSHTERTQHSSEPILDSFRKLECHVQSLLHQMQGLMSHQGHHITAQEPGVPQSGNQSVGVTEAGANSIKGGT